MFAKCQIVLVWLLLMLEYKLIISFHLLKRHIQAEPLKDTCISSFGDPYSCSVLVVTSPSPLNPDTTMLKSVIDSALKMFSHQSLARPRVTVLCDGYKVIETNRSANNGWADCKTGRVSKEASELYESFVKRLEDEYAKEDCGVNIQRLDEHNGFALSVRHGLMSTNATYCLILQHDRIFINHTVNKVPLTAVFDAFTDNKNIRYIGFPTVKSSQQHNTQNIKYDTDTLSNCQIALPGHSEKFLLYPLMFWLVF